KMKAITRLTAIIVCATLSMGVFAQQKLGHINSQELFALMPEADSAQKKLEALAKDHELTLEEMTVEFNKKLDEYQKNMETYSELKKATKESELEELQKRIAAFQRTAEQDLQQQRMAIFKPVQDRALKAVNEVAEEQKFTYIFDTSMGAIAFMGDDAIDIMPLVKEKLNIK
ncbi:MAG: OmpH family outer membrane protein, partial [Bacteroidales bacterium]|nr:OmpH family outer membrane protein [Bacteroidales bacterium]